MLLNRINGATSVILRVKLLNSSVSTGAGLTGLTSASGSLVISTIADNEAAATVYTQAGSTIETITTLGTYAAPTATKCRFKEVDATNHPGVYEIHLANARFAVTNAKSLLVSISGAANLAQCDFVIDLDSQVDVRAWIGTIVAGALQTAADVRAEIDSQSTQLAKIGTPAGASVSVDIAAVKTDTAAIKVTTDSVTARIPAALGPNGNMKADLRDFDGVDMIGDGTSGNNLRPSGVPAS